jgi:hypothetical protein
MPKISVVKDLMTDANNRYEAVNKCTYRSDRKKNAKLEDLPMVEKITGKTKEAAFEMLLPYLEDKYKKNEVEILQKMKEFQEVLNQYKDIIFQKIEELTKHPIDYDEIIMFLTTYRRCPYDREKGYIRLAIDADKSRILTILAHEVLHFQFHKYYSNLPRIKSLNFEQFDTIKESLTFLLNFEFKGIPM